MRDDLRLAGRGIVVWALLALLVLGVASATAAPEVPWRFLWAEFAVSPEGSRLGYPVLAYDDYGDPLTELWVSRLDGSDAGRVAALSGAWDVCWYDAQHLAGVQFDHNRIPIVPLNGGEQRTLSLTDDFYWARPALSPDGRWVAFPAVRKEPRECGVFALDVETGEIKTLSEDVVKSFVDWSPDSKRIVYGEGGYQQIYRLKVADVVNGTVTDIRQEGVGARWSPDGKWIAYTGNVVRGGSWYGGVPADGSILKTNLETKETVVLTEPAVNRDIVVMGGPAGKRDDEAKAWELGGAILPVWSPEGKKIAYRRLHKVVQGRKDVLSEDQIWVMDADGSNQKMVAEEWRPYAWASDGKSLFVKGDNGISRVVLDTGERRQVVAWELPEPPTPQEADWKTVKSEGAEVKYAWIKPEYAQAILTLVTSARAIYADTFGCDMPEVVGVTLNKDSSARTRLWTDGESQVFLTIASMDDLAPPQKSGVFNIYGMCHELGHVAMYRRIRVIGLPRGVAEGWAHYAGSAVTDEVYKRHGEDLWPEPYDYSADGLARLARQSGDPRALEDPTSKAAAAFYQAHQRYGAEKVFAAMNEATSGRPHGKDLMLRFVNALAKSTGDETCRDLFPEELVVPKVDWQVADREITAKTVEGVTSIEDESGVLLKYDDGESDGKLSTAGSGHAVVFKRPEGNWAVDYVEMYGSRYGTETPPKDNFSISICDQDFEVIKEIEEPYARLERGDPKWYRFEFEPVPVPEGFYVCIYFSPTYYQGFYVHYDADCNKVHSRSALPWSFVHDAEFDWMIRVHLQQGNG